MKPWSRCLAAASLCHLILSALVGCSHVQHESVAQASSDPGTSQAQPAGAAAPELIELRMLLIAYKGAQGADSQQQRTAAEALDRAAMLSTMVKSGDHLIELVTKYSDRPDAATDLGLVRVRPSQPGGFSAAMVSAALALPVGGISDAVATPEGYVVLERMQDPPVGPEQISARHILIIYVGSPQPVAGATRTEAEARSLAAQIVVKAKQPGADWSALATEYTEEPGGKDRAGDLGAFGRGQMVPAFERAAFGLAVGEISDVVQSPFGFHVIQRYR